MKEKKTTLIDLKQKATQRVRKHRESSRYKKTKLSAENVCVIKKALQAFSTNELEFERLNALALFNKEDYFLILYSCEKRSHVKKAEQINLFSGLMEKK
jgi:hypothetical protein